MAGVGNVPGWLQYCGCSTIRYQHGERECVRELSYNKKCMIQFYESINPLQTLISLLRSTKQINNIPVTIRISVMFQLPVLVG